MGIIIKSKRRDAAGGRFATAGGVITFDKNGQADVDVATAASLVSHPDFELADVKDRPAINEYIDSRMETPDGYDAGVLVRGHCHSMAGAALVASDGAKVEFGIDGYTLLGENTARALQSVLGAEFTFEGLGESKDGAKPKAETKEEPKAKEKPKAKPEAAKPEAVKPEAAKKVAGKTPVKVVSSEIPNKINVG